MASELEALQATAVGWPVSPSATSRSGRATRLVPRLAGGRFLVAAVGEFKRGMSPLISALVAEEVQPTGVRPRISVAAGLAYGEAVAVVERNGTRAERAGCKAAVATGLAVSAEGGA